MGAFRNITCLVTKLTGMRRLPVICERCVSGEVAQYLVSSDEIRMKVCAACAEEARKLGLTVKPLGRRKRAA
jgi:hypothetical protein